jgi:PIN domain nuclease of toxin-antitoxin system
MTVMVDTQTFLWWNTGDTRLSMPARRAISDPANEVIISTVVGWEIAIKAQIGKLPLPDSPDKYVPDRIRRNGFTELPITMVHALAVFSLPLIHRDPFDRILVAQCQVENIPIITADLSIGQYAVSVIW